MSRSLIGWLFLSILFCCHFAYSNSQGANSTNATTSLPSTATPTTPTPSTATATTVTPTTATPSTATPSTAVPTTVAATTPTPSTVAPSTSTPTTVAPSTASPTSATNPSAGLGLSKLSVAAPPFSSLNSPGTPVGFGAYSTIRCNGLPDPYTAPSLNPSSETFIVLKENVQNFYVSNLGKVRGPLGFISREGGEISLSQTKYPLLSPPASCVTIYNPLTNSNVTSTPLFSKSVDIIQNGNENAAIVSNPNRDMTQTFSFLTIVKFEAGVISEPQYIKSFVTAQLGLVISADVDTVAAYVSPGLIHLYHPILDRKYEVFNRGTGGDEDSLISMPNNFYIDSLSLIGNTLAITGSLLLSGTSLEYCQPALLVYTKKAGTNDWTLTGTGPVQLIRSTSPVSAPYLNTLVGTAYCPTDVPSSAFPVNVSPDQARILVGVPAWNSVFLGNADLATAFGYLPALTSVFNGFGTRVHHIFATNFDSIAVFVPGVGGGLVMIPRTAFTAATITANVNITTTGTGGVGAMDLVSPIVNSIIPNRNTRRKRMETRYLLDFAVTSSLASAVYNSDLSNPDTELLPFPIQPAGRQFSYDEPSFGLGDFANCTKGRYRPATPPAFDGCLLCPSGTYQSATGQTSCIACNYAFVNGSVVYPSTDMTSSYCPEGSPYPYNILNINTTEFDENGTAPEFEAKSFRQGFEDLLINSLFVASSPLLVILYCITAFILLVLLIAILTAEKHDPAAKSANKVSEFILGILTYFAVPEGGPGGAGHGGGHGDGGHGGGHGDGGHGDGGHGGAHGGHDGHHDSHADAHGHDAAHHHSTVGDHHHSTVGDHHDVSLTPQLRHRTASTLVREKEDADHGQTLAHLNHTFHTRESQVQGYFNIVFGIFAINALIFALTFYFNYDTGAPCFKPPGQLDFKCPGGTTEAQESRINRYRYEDLDSVDIKDPSAAAGINGLGLEYANVTMDFIGLTGFECKRDTYLNGDIKVLVDGCQMTTTDANGNFQLCNSSQFVDVYEYENEELPGICRIVWTQGLGSLLDTTSSMRLVLPSQTNFVALRLWYLENGWWGLNSSYVNDPMQGGGQFTLGRVVFKETIQQNLGPDNYIPANIFREWTFGILAWRWQTPDSSEPIRYFSTWYNTVKSQYPVFFPTNPVPFQDDPSNAVTFQLRMITTLFFRRQTVEKLIQANEALLTILLSIIGVFHLIHFIREVSEVCLYIYYDSLVKAERARLGIIRRKRKQQKKKLAKANEISDQKDQTHPDFGSPTQSGREPHSPEMGSHAQPHGQHLLAPNANGRSSARNSGSQPSAHGQNVVMHLNDQHGATSGVDIELITTQNPLTASGH